MTEPKKDPLEEADKFDSEAVPSTKIKEQPEMGGKGRSARTEEEAELSAVSKQYDIEGKGYLTESQEVMRKYDVNNDGQLDMSEIYKIVKDLQRQQKELNEERKKILDLKRVIIFLCCFTVILALAMLGVSFAAAVLAKETRVNPTTASLDNKVTGEHLSTVAAGRDGGEVFIPENITDEEPGSRLLLSHGSWAANEFRRRAQEERELFPSMRPRPPGERVVDDDRDNNNNGRPYNDWDDDWGNDPYRPNNPTDYRPDDWRSCRDHEGTISFSTFQSVRRDFQRNTRSITLYVNNRRGNSQYRKTIDVYGGFNDRRNDFLVIEGREERQCGRRSCRWRTPVWIFDCQDSRRNDCDLYSCMI